MMTWWFLTLMAFYLFLGNAQFFSFAFLTNPAFIQNILVVELLFCSMNLYCG